MDLRRLLDQHFGFREFLEGQQSIIEAILKGRDTLIIMPTGGGKSLCYQLPALVLEGITIVVSPLIALMKDQVDALTEKKIPATFINSSIPQAEVESRIQRMMRGEFRLVYIAPERFKSERFIRALAPLSIALFAVDEAHCISQWGHDFRPDYLRLKGALQELHQPQVAALTATATPEVRRDIVEQLGLGRSGRQAPEIFVSGFARHNLTLAVSRVKSHAEKEIRIMEIRTALQSGIIYCATRKNVERVTLNLRERGVRCVAYHGGMTDENRTRAQAEFMSGQCNIAVATNAFGMGIDRPDLRFVAHYDIPGSVEAYYQEAGRAGRDGEPARCELLFNYADVQTQEFFIEGSNPTREIIADVHHALVRLCRRGPIEMPIAEIARALPETTNEMAVGSALVLLERARFIQRDYRAGGRSYTTKLVEPVKSLDQLQIDFARLDGKRQRDFAKLGEIIAYADAQGCRHQFILKYFGDTEAAGHCNVCDNCLSRAGIAARLPTDEETLFVRKALSCVARVSDRFGRGRIAQVLAGSRSKEVVDAGLDHLSTYGLLSDVGADYVWTLLNALIDAGCIAVSDGQYPTISLTPLGGEVMRGKKNVPLVLPARVGSKAAKGKRTKSSGPAERAESEFGNDELFEALRIWRREKAAAMGNVPAYVIYSDKTLYELSRLMPRTETDLLRVRGIGPGKARQFGAETLGVIQQFVKKSG
ncbi:MAG: RecQ family ATP-dependent DNA helicase [Deltaproteobacteria bacterium]|nr:RecQ family ATP-dependent DNA helicase [Deltaproteobacteria bacterium]